MIENSASDLRRYYIIDKIMLGYGDDLIGDSLSPLHKIDQR